MAHLVGAEQRAGAVAAINGARYVTLTSFDDGFQSKESS